MADLLAHGTVQGDDVVFDDEVYATLAAKYRTSPGLAQTALNAVKASARFAASGFQKASQPTYLARQALCRACPEWDDTGHAGLGRCRKCGCSGIKLTWASERCPLGKWEKEAGPA